MKKFVLLLTAMASFASASPVIKTGTFMASYDHELQVRITKSIQVWLNKAGVSEMRIEDEDMLAATFEDGKISAYVAKPKKYFFYSLDMNPKTEVYDNTPRIVMKRGNGGSSGSVTHLVYTTSYCPQEATALLTAHAGDGTKSTFCVQLK